MDIQFVYAAWLKNPQLLPVGLQKKFSEAGLTPADYAQILSTDPFASGITTIDPLRYLPVDRSFPYIPPLNAQAAVLTQTFNQQSSVTHSASLSTQVQYGVTLGAFASVGVPMVFTAKLSFSDSLQWTNTSRVGTTSTSSESATSSLGTKGPARWSSFAHSHSRSRERIRWSTLF